MLSLRPKEDLADKSIAAKVINAHIGLITGGYSSNTMEALLSDFFKACNEKNIKQAKLLLKEYMNVIQLLEDLHGEKNEKIIKLKKVVKSLDWHLNDIER